MCHLWVILWVPSVKARSRSDNWVISVSGSCSSCSASNRDRHSSHNWCSQLQFFLGIFIGFWWGGLVEINQEHTQLSDWFVFVPCFMLKQCRTLILRQFYFCCFNWFQTFAPMMNWSDMTVTAASWLLILLTYLSYEARSSQACLNPVKVIAEWLLSAPPAVQIETQLCSSPWLGCL